MSLVDCFLAHTRTLCLGTSQQKKEAHNLTMKSFTARMVASMLPPRGTVPPFTSGTVRQPRVHLLSQHRVVAQPSGLHTQIKISASLKRLRRGIHKPPSHQGRCTICASKSPPMRSQSTVMCKECGIVVCRDHQNGRMCWTEHISGSF